VKRRAWRGSALWYVLTVFFLINLNFFLPRAMPGDPLSVLEDPATSDETTRTDLARYYGLDRPLPVQYVRYLGALAQGDLGTSIRYRAPVSDLVAERLPWTLLLTGGAMGIATGVGLLAGIHSGWRRGRPVDRGLLSLFMGIRNFPVFFLGSLAVFVFAVKLGWFPLAGGSTPFSESFGLLRRVADLAHHLVLPASVLAVQFTAHQYMVMRGSMVSERGAPYLLLGRAKGLRERRLKYAYAARNAMLPVATVAALQLGVAVTASIFVETVFAYPGLGRLIFDAVAFRDYPTLQGCFLVLAAVVLTLNFLSDRLYLKLDPRTGG
jgi:peptide/nickel transport system permease protein